MYLTEELKDQGRRNFMKALAGTPALVALGASIATRGPIHGGPVKAAVIGTGGEGRVLLNQCDKEFINIKALCDINPARRQKASEDMVKAGWAKPSEYEDWKEMLQKEDIEAVLIATPLWSHAEITVGCLEAGKHVLCEKMMAKDIEGCNKMMEAAKKSGKILEIGYQRFYNPIYQAAYDNIVKKGQLGDIYYARLVWHRNSSWKRKEDQPAGFDPTKWGYPDWEHLVNWRLYKRYSEGLMAELGSHQVAISNWFFDSYPQAVHATGNISQYKDGREVFDHLFVTLEYPNGRTATFTSIQSNEFDRNYEQIMGTEGTLIFRGESEAYLFTEKDDKKATNIEITKQQANEPVTDASASRIADSAGGGRTVENQSGKSSDRLVAYKNEISEFCSAVRTGSELRCGPERALKSAKICISTNEAAEKKARVEIKI
jgi:predicted dehydrogenase